MADHIASDIERVCQLSKNFYFDFVIVGSGLAGGVLARTLIEKDKKVLLIEKGGLTFSTHCLNTSRPHWQRSSTQGPSQDNDVVYSAVKDKVHIAAGSDPYVGGPVYCLGGRSTVWGLYSPKINDLTLKAYFPDTISKWLTGGGYDKAFSLMTNESQTYSTVYPQGLNALEETEVKKDLDKAIKDFCSPTKSAPTVSFAPLTMEFNSAGLYHFPQGAYSTADYLLDRLYARDDRLTLLLNTEVLSLERIGSSYNLSVRSVIDRSIHQIGSRNVILSAGTIGTVTIALSSGLQTLLPKVGKGLTDHEIWGARFIWDNEGKGKDPMKLQCEMKIGEKQALVNVAVNAESFLSRDIGTSHTQHLTNKGKVKSAESSTDANHDMVNITIEYEASLAEDNEVLANPSTDPVVFVKRVTADETQQSAMQKLAKLVRNNLCAYSDDPGPRLGLAGFGVVAHEVGTMRLRGPKTLNDYVVDENLQVKNRPNLYVCDLSVLPVSPAANPSVTLVALAMRLGDHLTK